MSLRKAIKNSPSFVPPHVNLAIALERQNKRKEAISILERAAKMDPKSEEVKSNLARMKKAQG
jgi:predicted Zn-dependent protease